ncbi:MAG: hypothetical protein ACXWKP_29830 [Bradyrhizobium sp.]
MTFWIVVLGLCGAIGWLLLRLLRPLLERPEDRSAIDIFAGQCGYRVIAVVRSNSVGYWLHEVVADDITRSYLVTFEDPAGNRGDIGVAFDPLFAAGQTDVPERQGLTLTSPGQVVNLTQYSSAPVRPGRYERVVIFAIGACIGGFIFSSGLHTNLSPPTRPLYPEPALGYTHLLKTKYGVAYGTYFEQLAVTYGIWVTWGSAAAIGLFSRALGILSTDREVVYSRNGWQVLAAVIVSYLLYYAIWRAFSL